MAISKSFANGNNAVARPPPVNAEALPSSSSTDLVLVPANPLESTQSSRLNADEWRGPLTIEQYMEREEFLFG